MLAMGNAPGPSTRLGYVLAGAALLVQVPRLLLMTPAVPPEAELLLSGVAAVAMAVVLTGGNLYLLHSALTAPRWRIALAVAWALVVGVSTVLVAPASRAA